MVNHQTDINFTDARDLHFVAFCGLFYAILLPQNLKNYSLQTIWPLVSLNHFLQYISFSAIFTFDVACYVDASFHVDDMCYCIYVITY